MGVEFDATNAGRAQKKLGAKITPSRGRFEKSLQNPAITYFRADGHYHRPWGLNGRVRNGNVCFRPGIVTGSDEPANWIPPAALVRRVISKW